MRGRDLILLTETHESPERSLPRIHGFQWESSYRRSTRQHTTRGSGGVAILFRQGLQRRVQIVARDPQARYIWIRVELSQDRTIYIALCYFAPSGSRFAFTEPEREGEERPSPYTCLSEAIMEYSTLGEVFLMGDFNARTCSDQCETYDTEDTTFHAIEEETTTRDSADTARITEYGHHLLRLGARHRLLIYNGMAQWPTSGSLTCIPHGVVAGGGSTVDYIMGSREATHLLSSFTIPPIPIGADHTYLALSLTGDTTPPTSTTHTSHTTIHFTHELAPLYSAEVEKGLLLLHPSTPLPILTTHITSILQTSAISSFPHTTHTGHVPPPGTRPHNHWYDDECRDLYRRLRAQRALGEITEQQAKRQMRTLTRRKRRAFEKTQELELYRLFMSMDSATAWRTLREPRATTPIEDPQIWHDYAERLYEVPGQPLIPQPPGLRPTSSSFFTAEMVERAIRRLQHRRSTDHTGIQSEHLIYAAATIAPLIAHVFNRAIGEGLPEEWTQHTIVPIHKSGDTLDPGNYRTIMIGHTMAKLYGAVLEAELSSYGETEGLRAPGQAGFRRTFSTIDHIFVLRCLIDGAKVRKKKLYCCFVDFRKAFDTVPRERLFRRLQSLGVPSEMIWAIYTLYERVTGRVRCPGGLSESIASTIGVKQGCPLSPTLFGLYIDEITDYILRAGGAGADMAGTPVHILLYADDIVLISETPEGLESHLSALDEFCLHRGLTVNLGKTKVMIFHTSSAARRAATFTAAGGPVEVVTSYVYLGVTFTSRQGPFSMAQAATDRLTRGYAALAMLERRCHQAHFQEPRTKGWLFDTLVTPALMYAAAVWAPGLTDSQWARIERPQICMISRLFRGKHTVPHDIIRAELASPPMVVEALFQTVCFIERVRALPADRLTRRAYESATQTAETGYDRAWYTQIRAWFGAHGLDLHSLPPFQYDPDAPQLHLSRSERNMVLRQDLWQLHISQTWITSPLRRKMSHYRDHFLTILEDGFIQRPHYMDTYMPHSSRVAIGQLRVASHRLEIEAGRAHDIPMEERVCRVCREEVESEEHFVCRCRAYDDIRERYEPLFRGQPSLREIMHSRDQRQLGRYLLEAQRYRDTLLQPPTETSVGGRQSQLTDFFQRTTPPPLPAPVRGVTLYQAETIRRRRRPRITGGQPPRLHHRQIEEIQTRARRAAEERRAQMMADPAAFIRAALAPDPPMYQILHPPLSTGWS